MSKRTALAKAIVEYAATTSNLGITEKEPGTFWVMDRDFVIEYAKHVATCRDHAFEIQTFHRGVEAADYLDVTMLLRLLEHNAHVAIEDFAALLQPQYVYSFSQPFSLPSSGPIYILLVCAILRHLCYYLKTSYTVEVQLLPQYLPLQYSMEVTIGA